MIDIRNFYKSFGKLKVLDGINIAIDSGAVFAILGPNGSGKTTLLKSILGMVIPNSGVIRIEKKSIIREWKYRNKISYMPQVANFPPNLKVREIIKIFKIFRSEISFENDLIKSFNLESSLEKKFSTLSGGTKQKVNIVLAFMFDSPIIILDEPTTGLDPLSLIKLKKVINDYKHLNKTILVSSHIMGFVEEISDRIVFLLDGKIEFNGTVDQIKKNTKKNNLEKSIAHILNNKND